jgi:hypothetical protein
MDDFNKYFKLFNKDGKNFDKWKKEKRIPSIDESIEKIGNKKRSEYPLRTIGFGDEEFYISEEEREANMHIIGQPRQGKSKLLEDQIRKDIDLGNGLCLLDPSENGDTAKKVLRYCALKGIEKVVYIDPNDCFQQNRIPTIQPIKPYPYREQSIDAIAQSLNDLFGVANQTDTNRIRRNLIAVLNIIARNNLTLYETKYFRNYTDAERLPYMNIDEDSMIIKDGFSSRSHFNQYFMTTVGRLDLFRSNPIRMMTAANTGIDFRKMVREGWVILVNLSPNRILSKTQARLLGIMIISEIIQAMTYLFETPPESVIKKVFYLYMDEAGRFATPQISELLDYFAKVGLRLIIAHHDFSQFKDKDVLTTIKNGCRIKMMFNISSYKDRLEMSEDLGYGGDIHPILAAYVNQNIPKREMIIKKDKETPVRIRVPDVPDVTRQQVSDEALKDYVKRILEQPWYLTKEEIIKQIDVRSLRANIKSPQSGKVDDTKTGSKAAVPKRVSGKLEGTVRPGDKKSSEPPPKRPIKI